MPATIHSRIVKKTLALSAVALLSAAAVSLTATEARAESSGISATGKGITGGALLGGELVMASEAALGVQNTWMYVLGGVLGAGAGGFGGYYVEGNADAQYSYFMLAGGLALAIPTTVAVLQAASYHYESDYQPDAAPADMTPSDQGPSSAPSNSTQASRNIPFSIVGLQEGNLQLGVPAVAVVPTYTPTEVKKFGVKQRTELRVPVFSAVF